jgi:hypothetical protein
MLNGDEPGARVNPIGLASSIGLLLLGSAAHFANQLYGASSPRKLRRCISARCQATAR